MMQSQVFRTLVNVLFFSVALSAVAGAKAPKLLGAYFKLDEPVEGNIVSVKQPEGIKAYLDKVNEAAKADPKWFVEYSEKATPNVPLPFHEKLGLTKKEYDEYRALWKKREFVSLQKVGIRLEKDGDEFMIRVTGKGAKISLLRFNPEKGTFRSPNGPMERLDDIDTDPESILGGWKGQEWRYLEESSLGLTKENFAVGKTDDGKTGMMIYRLQDVSSTGRMLYDQSAVIRFALPGKGK